MKQLLGLSSGLCMMRAFLCDENGAWLNYMILEGWTFFGHVILRRHNCLVSMLEVLLFVCRYWTFILNLMDLNILSTIKKIILINMLGSIPHQKFCFYHLPTRGRAGIKLGDAWYVSNVSIIFYCSTLLYYWTWMFSGYKSIYRRNK